ncbi:hypothetical protein LR032_00095 [Candidatus Bipolaricaulota bacterium]|nr:hypothetical protein [Candidatus Bipolaricaulota bacterium]
MTRVIDQVRIAVEGSASFQEACALTVALLRRHALHFDWVGIYLLEGDLLDGMGRARGDGAHADPGRRGDLRPGRRHRGDGGRRRR